MTVDPWFRACAIRGLRSTVQVYGPRPTAPHSDSFPSSRQDPDNKLLEWSSWLCGEALGPWEAWKQAQERKKRERKTPTSGIRQALLRFASPLRNIGGFSTSLAWSACWQPSTRIYKYNTDTCNSVQYLYELQVTLVWTSR
jgi:hypothetical protein